MCRICSGGKINNYYYRRHHYHPLSSPSSCSDGGEPVYLRYGGGGIPIPAAIMAIPIHATGNPLVTARHCCEFGGQPGAKDTLLLSLLPCLIREDSAASST